MKKFVCLSTLVLMCLSVVLADPALGAASGAVGANPGAYTVVKLDLTQTGDAYVDLWFEGGEDTTYNSISNPKESVNLEFEDGSVVASNSANGSNEELYACWRIVSGNSIAVELALKDKMKIDDTNGGIDWKVAWDGKDKISSSGLTTEPNAEVYAELTGDTEKSGLETRGKKALTISTTTTDFTSLTAGKYSANLYLRCKTN